MKRFIYIFRYHGRNSNLLGELINYLCNKYSGEFISIEDQSEISFLFPLFNFIEWKTPKKFVIMKLEKSPKCYCKNCNFPVDIENLDIVPMNNFKKVICKSCGILLMNLDTAESENIRICGKAEDIEIITRKLLET